MKTMKSTLLTITLRVAKQIMLQNYNTKDQLLKNQITENAQLLKVITQHCCDVEDMKQDVIFKNSPYKD